MGVPVRHGRAPQSALGEAVDDAIAGAEPWQARTWRSAEGLILQARDYPAGAGPARLPVVCLHGLTRNACDFDALAPWIAATKGRRVLAVDVRGRGGSARDPAADYRLPRYAADVARMFATLGIAHAIFVGTSMGGLITMEVANATPGLVHAAVLNDIGPELAPAGLARIAGYVGAAVDYATWEEAAGHCRRINAAVFPHYREDDWRRMAARTCREQGGRIVADYDPAIARPFGDAPVQDDPWARWATLADKREILILRGELSDLLERPVAARMAAAGPSVAVCEIPAVGHAPMLDEPAALAAIGSFLDRLA